MLACAVRLLDRGFFRIGSEQYACRTSPTASPPCARSTSRSTPSGTGWCSTTRPRAASAASRACVDPDAFEVVAALKRRRGGGPELLAYKNGRAWSDVRSPDINDYLKEATGDDFSAKDFRTWTATMLAAIALAVSGEVAATRPARKRAVARAVKEVSHYLGNTPAVCRASYIDPRVIDAYNGGLTIAGVLGEIADTAQARRAADPPAGGRARRARPAQRAGGVAGSGAGGGLTGASRRRSAGPPVTPWTTIETITHAIAVHTTTRSSPSASAAPVTTVAA